MLLLSREFLLLVVPGYAHLLALCTMTKAMGNMVQRAKSILNEFTVLYDKGFHTGSELKMAQDLGVETIVAVPGVPSTSQAPDHDYNYEHFIYDEQADTYTCPEGQVMGTNGSWYKQYSSTGSISLFKQYRTKACRKCPGYLAKNPKF